MPITDAPFDYDAEQRRIKRALAQAQALRSQSAAPQGQMVGNRFVAPSWSQQLAPVLNQLMGGYQQGAADREDQALGQRAQTEATNWLQQRPQPKQVELQGPTLDQEPLTGIKVPTQQDNLAWAQQGATNPLTKALAATYSTDRLINEPVREEARQFRASESAAARQAKAEEGVATRTAKAEQLKTTNTAHLAELQLKLASAGEDRNLRAAISSQMQALSRANNHLDNQTKLDIAEAKLQAAGQNVKPVPHTVVKHIGEAKEAAGNITNAAATFKPEYAGVPGTGEGKYGGLGGLGVTIGTYVPGAPKESVDTAEWWKNYEDSVAMVRRHSLFGSALTKPEIQSWTDATITRWMSPETIQRNLATQNALAHKVYNHTREQYINSGYPQVDAAFEPSNAQFQFTPMKPTKPPEVNVPGTRRVQRGAPTAVRGLPQGWTEEQ